MENLDINWDQYFKSIEKVCPWSLTSYQQGRIDFVPYSQHGMWMRDRHWIDSTQPHFDAVVYVDAPNDTETLDRICEVYEDSMHCVYFWSHPEYTKGLDNQTSIPIIIQQDKKSLFKARSNRKKHK